MHDMVSKALRELRSPTPLPNFAALIVFLSQYLKVWDLNSPTSPFFYEAERMNRDFTETRYNTLSDELHELKKLKSHTNSTGPKLVKTGNRASDQKQRVSIDYSPLEGYCLSVFTGDGKSCPRLKAGKPCTAKGAIVLSHWDTFTKLPAAKQASLKAAHAKIQKERKEKVDP
jgi:hypothetical protein